MHLLCFNEHSSLKKEKHIVNCWSWYSRAKYFGCMYSHYIMFIYKYDGDFHLCFQYLFLFKMNALSKVKLCPGDQVCFDCKKTMSTLNDHSKIVYNLSIF